MGQGIAAGVGLLAVVAAAAAAQTNKPAGAKPVMHRITVTADSVYTGTMETTVVKGKVIGKMHITAPTEIVGDVSGTTKAGGMTLEFPYRMTVEKCDGTVKMNLTIPAKPGAVTGTMEAYGCGREPAQKLTGTVQLVPVPAK